ncbi:alpha-1,2-fucosyltransferase [bacterium]|nr:MAG: alpha-1,2-fucosyltransferase [bacterium]
MWINWNIFTARYINPFLSIVGTNDKDKMIIIRMKGGLGNQLFQYATGRALAIRKGVALKLDTSWFGNQSKRQYQLSHFKITAAIATPDEVAKLRGENVSGIRAWVSRYLQSLRPYYKRSVFNEQYFYFDTLVFNAARDVYLEGYWGSEKYFTVVAETIRSELTVKDPWDDENWGMYQQICEVDSISLHVRRGDYANDPANNQAFGTCALEYYYQALALLIGRLRNPHVFVFSDDIEWVQKNLVLKAPHTYMSHNGPGREYEDLRLMSHCRNHITANSTFSWWGAWLSPFQDKIVIAPKRWYRNMNRDTRDLLPRDWIQV